MLKRIICILISTVLMFSVTAFADEFSDSAEIDYGYNGDYDETTSPNEETSNKFDDSDSFYDESYDETVDDSSYYGDEELEPIDDSFYNDNNADFNNDEYISDEEDNQYSDRNTDGITVYVNGEKVWFDVEPMLINDRTMVPMRAIFEALGAVVGWDDETQTVYGETTDVFVEMAIGANYLLKNGEKISLDSPAVIISDRTLVPVRAIAESMHCSVDWDEDSQVVAISKMGVSYDNEWLKGKWDVVGEIDAYTELIYYGEVVGNFEFMDNGKCVVTYYPAQESNSLNYKITKSGIVTFVDGEGNYIGMGRFSAGNKDLLVHGCYLDEYGESTFSHTENGDVIRKSYYTDKNGVKLIEDDDGIILSRTE